MKKKTFKKSATNRQQFTVEIIKAKVKTVNGMNLLFNCITRGFQSTMIHLYVNINRPALNEVS